MNTEQLAAHLANDINCNLSTVSGSGPDSEGKDNGIEFKYDALAS